MTWIGFVIVLLAAVVCRSLCRRLPAAAPSRHPVQTADMPAQALRIDRLVRAGIAHAGDVHLQLRPLLTDAVEPALARRGLALDGAEEPVRAVLGERLWEVVRPGRPRPEDPWGPGLSRRDLARMLDDLEEL
ncbi:MAG: hypothetical protein ACXVFN_17115 [Solirubrobacteraceae bacterium]